MALVAAVAMLLHPAALFGGDRLDLALPTANTAIFDGRGEEFYMFTDRDFEGMRSTPWEAGKYGYVRNPRRFSTGVEFTRFHEGIDIRPLVRDPSGKPLDAVRAIAAGSVVYASSHSGRSNYGRYVVVEHRWDGSPYYSLYAHLNEIAVRAGQRVERGEQLGLLGSTGRGLDQRRAHLHLELNLMLSREFEAWHRATFRGDTNWHGLYNGLNLAGLDIAALYLALAKDPTLTIPQFIARQQVEFKVLLPPTRRFVLLEMYPWMLADADGAKGNPPGWEISFDSTGLPLRIEPAAMPVASPALSWLRTSPVPATHRTKGLVHGSSLSSTGQSLMLLLAPPETR